MIGKVIVPMPFMLTSGLMSPIMNMPDALQYPIWRHPLRYAIGMMLQIYLAAAGTGQLFPQMPALLAIVAVALPVAVW